MAWCIIENGSRSSSPLIRVMALLGAFFGQDARGVDILCRNMRDNNAKIRAVAVELSGKMFDARLQDEVYRIFLSDRSWNVRLQAIEAVGSMKIERAQPRLFEIISDDAITAEERAAASAALVNMLEDADRKDIARLATSDRAGLRLLACKIILHLERKEESYLLIPLLHDHHAGVREAAVQTLGVLRIDSIQGQPAAEIIRPLLNDSDPYVAITAAWAMTLLDPSRAEHYFRNWLNDSEKEIRSFAAAALASTGKYGLPYTKKAFDVSTDPFVRMNLALGLISQRADTTKATNELYRNLMNSDQRWMWEDTHGFRTLMLSKVRHDEMIPNKPEAMNQATRLEILNILTFMKHPQAQTAVRNFLAEKNWGITGMAAALLLTEGDDTAVEVVENLLNDPEPKIRIQAALILSMWGHDEGAIAVLQNGYAAADRETKEKILEGLGRVAAASSIPFLVDKLNEQSQSLRIIAAASLLLCLNG